MFRFWRFLRGSPCVIILIFACQPIEFYTLIAGESNTALDRLLIQGIFAVRVGHSEKRFNDLVSGTEFRQKIDPAQDIPGGPFAEIVIKVIPCKIVIVNVRTVGIETGIGSQCPIIRIG